MLQLQQLNRGARERLGLAGGADQILIPEFEVKVEDIVAHLYKRRGEDRDFSISAVSDDGIFTYVRLAKSQDRPVVYAGESNNEKKLEPVKYTDEGEYYIVHRVLQPGQKRFFLKLGDRVSEVRRVN